MSQTNYLEEAGRLVKMIDEMKLKEKDYMFIQSIKARVKANDFVSQKQIFWLRDLKDRQLEKGSSEGNEGFQEYSDKNDRYRD